MLWLRNDEAMYRYYLEKIRACMTQHGKIDADNAKLIAQAVLGVRTRDGVRLGSTSKADWAEIANAMMEDAQ